MGKKDKRFYVWLVMGVSLATMLGQIIGEILVYIFL